MITKVVMIKKIVFLLNIKTDVPKCICEGWDLVLAHET
jgi:hypothetical protein